jgi:teichuronic acid biosynthesis glycosyltransferase TuaC
MTRVLFVTRWYPTETKPAKGLFVREHARAAAVDNQVVVLHVAGPEPSLPTAWALEDISESDLALGLPTYRVWYRPPAIPRTEYARFVMSGLRGIAAVTRSRGPWDIVHAHEFDAAVVAHLSRHLARFPHVVTEHSTAFPRRALSRRALWRARWAFRSAEAILPVSHSLRDAIIELGGTGRFVVIPNTVDLTMFQPAESIAAGESRNRRLTVVSRLSEVKGISNLLGACALLAGRRTDWRLDVVGDGIDRARYEQRARELGLGDRITFHGLQPRDVVARFLQQSDLHIVPSDQETFCVAAVEALACGTPVVATRSGGPEEFVTPSVGRLVEPRNPEALAAAIDAALETAFWEPEAISAYARERFSHDAVGRRLSEIYRALLDNHS